MSHLCHAFAEPGGVEIAQEAEFFFFGTNDLTQTTFGFSRDDAERHFIVRYLEQKILPRNPFEGIDVDGVGRPMEMAVKEGRKTRAHSRLESAGSTGVTPTRSTCATSWV